MVNGVLTTGFAGGERFGRRFFGLSQQRPGRTHARLGGSARDEEVLAAEPQARQPGPVP